jgi:hypothetical protein
MPTPTIHEHSEPLDQWEDESLEVEDSESGFNDDKVTEIEDDVEWKIDEYNEEGQEPQDVEEVRYTFFRLLWYHVLIISSRILQVCPNHRVVVSSFTTPEKRTFNLKSQWCVLITVVLRVG